jgi:hypothetical protein
MQDCVFTITEAIVGFGLAIVGLGLLTYGISWFRTDSLSHFVCLMAGITLFVFAMTWFDVPTVLAIAACEP